MEITYRCEHTDQVDPSSLKAHPKNPNKHPSRQVDMLSKNIKRFGWRHPIVVSKRSGYIIAGHCRREAAVKLGCKAPVDYQDFDDETEELAVLMADNIIPELAQMDEELKELNLGELRELEMDLDELGVVEDDLEESDDIGDIDIPDILINEKMSLERVTLFVEETVKKEVLKAMRAIISKYPEGMVRIVT